MFSLSGLGLGLILNGFGGYRGGFGLLLDGSGLSLLDVLSLLSSLESLSSLSTLSVGLSLLLSHGTSVGVELFSYDHVVLSHLVLSHVLVFGESSHVLSFSELLGESSHVRVLG